MRYFYLTFFCLFLLRPAPSLQDDRSEGHDAIQGNHMEMGSTFIQIPEASSGDEEGTTIEISFQSDEAPAEEILDHNKYNDTNIVSKRSGERFGHITRRSHPLGSRRSDGKKQFIRNNPNNIRNTPISMLGAAINVLNPMPYFRESFNGFKSVLRHNIKPFQQFVAKPGDQYHQQSNLVKTRLKGPRPSSHGQQELYENEELTTTTSTTTSAPTTNDVKLALDSVAESSSHTNHGFNLRIPPELANYSALEVNLKPNGEIDIVPVEKNDSYSKNLVSQTTSNEPVVHSFPYSPQVPRKYSATNHFNSFQNPSFPPNSVFNEFPRPSSKVKLVSDSPVVINSIQDIIKLHNLVGADNSNAKLSNLENLFKNSPIPVDLSHLFSDSINNALRQNEQISNSFPNSGSPEHIYLLPFKVDEENSRTSQLQTNSPPATSLSTPSFTDTEDDASEIYYIDITIPGGGESKPVVNHQRFKRKNGQIFNKLRRKRSAFGTPNNRHDKHDNRRIRYVDYDGWRPLDVVDPMSNEPTLVYKPPSLKMVHFGEGPPEEKPMFPIVPVNPTVYVVRAEPVAPTAKRHAIYGTEKVDYLHINPQSNSAKVYSSFHDIQDKNNPKSESNDNLNNNTGKTPPANVTINVKKIKEELESSVTTIQPEIDYETGDEMESTTENLEIELNQAEDGHYEATNFTGEELLERENVIPVAVHPKTTENSVVDWFTNPFYKFAELLMSANSTKEQLNEEADNGTETNETSNLLEEEQQFSEKAFSVGDDYYYVYEDSEDEPSESFKPTDLEDMLASSSDPFESIIPRIKPVSEEDLEDPYVSPEDPEENREYSESQQTKESTRRAPLHELLKNFDGVQFDRYIFSASENEEKEYLERLPARPTPNSRFRSQSIPKSLRAETGRKIGPAPKGKNHREWYLIETRTVEPPPNKKKVESQYSRRNEFSNRYLSKYADGPFIYNRYLDDHLNSFKPTDGLTANSLSELLQIFKYVTTPVPYQDKPVNNAKERRTFRYTKPTIPPRFTTERPGQFTTFRYTISAPDYPSYTDLPFEDISVLEGPLIVMNDSVADTNSLDGYLFSDSVASPEYKTLESQPNIIRFDAKEEARVRFDKIAEDTKMMDRDAIRRGELSPSLIIDAPKNSDKEKDPLDLDSSAYHIYEGHSKVKVFGANVNENGTQKKDDSKKAKSLVPNPYSFYNHITTLPPGVVIRPIVMMAAHSPFKNQGMTSTERTTSQRSMSATKTFSATVPQDVFTTSQYTTEYDRFSIVDRAETDSKFSSNVEDSIVRFPSDYYDYYSLHGKDDTILKDKIESFGGEGSNDEIKIDIYPERELNFKNPRPPHYSPTSKENFEETQNLTGKTERLLDLSILPSSLESFSRLILSYFARNNEENKSEERSSSPKGNQEDKTITPVFTKNIQENKKTDKTLEDFSKKQISDTVDYLSYLKRPDSNE